MAFGFNGVSLSHQPTTHKWVDRDVLGLDGNAHPIYPAYRDYELQWDYLSASDFNEVYGYYSLVGQTGTVIASLPEYAAATYGFRNYTGCVLQEPRFNGYYEEHYENVTLLIARIRV